MGQGGISENHPCAPGYYDAERDPETGKVIVTYSRAYFRKPSKDTIPSNAE